MRKIIIIALVATGVASVAFGAEWAGAWKPFKGSYTIYSGSLAEREAPTPRERTMTISIEDQSARDIFDSIGPDLSPTCSQEKGDRDRRKRGVQCTYSPHGDGKGYRCWIGINLRTGDSTPTVSC